MEMTDARGHPPVVSWLLSERDASETEPVLLFLGGCPGHDSSGGSRM